MGLAEGPQPTLDQRRIGQNPAVQGGVVDLQAALDEQLLDVTIAERIAQVPGDGLQDQRRLEVAALEIVLRPALQPLDKGTQDHGSPPTSEAQTHPACSTRGKRPEFATSPLEKPLIGFAPPVVKNRASPPLKWGSASRSARTPSVKGIRCAAPDLNRSAGIAQSRFSRSNSEQRAPATSSHRCPVSSNKR